MGRTTQSWASMTNCHAKPSPSLLNGNAILNNLSFVFEDPTPTSCTTRRRSRPGPATKSQLSREVARRKIVPKGSNIDRQASWARSTSSVKFNKTEQAPLGCESDNRLWCEARPSCPFGQGLHVNTDLVAGRCATTFRQRLFLGRWLLYLDAVSAVLLKKRASVPRQELSGSFEDPVAGFSGFGVSQHWTNPRWFSSAPNTRRLARPSL